MMHTHVYRQSISHALLHLAAEPKYLKPLRDEVEAIISVEGWTKAAMGKLWNIDSFLKESQRVNGVGLGTSLVHSSTHPLHAVLTPTHFKSRARVRPYRTRHWSMGRSFRRALPSLQP